MIRLRVPVGGRHIPIGKTTQKTAPVPSHVNSLCPDLPAMHGYDSPGNGQPQPKPFVCSGKMLFQLVKIFKTFSSSSSGYIPIPLSDIDITYLVFIAFGIDGYLSVIRCKADGIIENIDKYLGKSFLIRFE